MFCSTESTLANALFTLFRSIDPAQRQGPRGCPSDCRTSAHGGHADRSPPGLHASLTQIVDLAAAALDSPSRLVLDAVLDGMRAFFDKLAAQASSHPLSDNLEDILQRCVEDFLLSTTRASDPIELSRLKAAEATLTLCGVAGLSQKFRTVVKSKADVTLEHERAYSVQSVLLRVRTLSAV